MGATGRGSAASQELERWRPDIEEALERVQHGRVILELHAGKIVSLQPEKKLPRKTAPTAGQ